MNNKDNKLVKFTYFVDPACEGRIVCVARRVIGNSIHVAFSVNRSVTLNAEVRPVRATKTDQRLFAGVRLKEKRTFVLEKFSKPKARAVATAKLDNEPHLSGHDGYLVLDRVEGVPPIRTVTQFVSSHKTVPKKIREICKRSVVADALERLSNRALGGCEDSCDENCKV